MCASGMSGLESPIGCLIYVHLTVLLSLTQECMLGTDVNTVGDKRVLRVIKILRILKIMRLLKGFKLVE